MKGSEGSGSSLPLQLSRQLALGDALRKDVIFHGASTTTYDAESDCPIHCVQHIGTLCFFLWHCVDPNLKDANKRAPLHRGAFEGFEALVGDATGAQ